MNWLQIVAARAGVSELWWKWFSDDLETEYCRWRTPSEFAKFLVGVGFAFEEVAAPLRQVAAVSPAIAAIVSKEVNPAVDWSVGGAMVLIGHLALDGSFDAMLMDVYRTAFPLDVLAAKIGEYVEAGTPEANVVAWHRWLDSLTELRDTPTWREHRRRGNGNVDVRSDDGQQQVLAHEGGRDKGDVAGDCSTDGAERGSTVHAEPRGTAD